MVELDRSPEARAAREALPLITLDFDGVICSPILGVNLGIQRRFLDPDEPPVLARVPPRWLGRTWDHVRFDLRRPLPDARAGLEALHALRRVVVLTGRRTSPRWWLRRHGLSEYVDDVVVNGTALRSAHFKLEALRRLEAGEHVDDDPRTAQLLAQRSPTRVYLRDWRQNRGLEFASSVTRITDLRALAAELRGSQWTGR